MLRFSSPLLALLVLFGSAGLPVNRHFCGGKLMSVAVFGEAKKCHADQRKKQCPFHPAPAEEDRKDCCEDEYDWVQVDDQERTGQAFISTQIATVADLPVPSGHYHAPPARTREDRCYRNYRPPPLLTDVSRVFQVFLI